MKLLKKNMKKNACNRSSVTRLIWGQSRDPLREDLHLKSPPDFILASDVVYGNDKQKWKALIETMKNISGQNTLIVCGNVRRYPVGHPLAEETFYAEATKDDFFRVEVPSLSKVGAGECTIHAMRLKPGRSNQSKRKKGAIREETRKKKKRKNG